MFKIIPFNESLVFFSIDEYRIIGVSLLPFKSKKIGLQLRLKAKDIYKNIDSYMNELESLLSVKYDLATDQRRIEKVVCVIEQVQSLLESIGNSSSIDKELHQKFNSLKKKKDINTTVFSDALTHVGMFAHASSSELHVADKTLEEKPLFRGRQSCLWEFM